MPDDLTATLARLLDAESGELRALVFAWARAAPTVVLVPAFGLRAVPAPVRITLGLALAAAVAPSLVATNREGPWAVSLLVEAAKGLPVALSAAVALWVAGMAGGLIDDLRGARERSGLPTAEPDATPLSALLGLLAAVAFLESGGPVRVARALSAPDLAFYGPLLRAASNVASGIGLALAIAAPLVAAALVLEVASALVARAAHPAYVQPMLAPLRTVLLLAVLAVILERIVELLALYAASVP